MFRCLDLLQTLRLLKSLHEADWFDRVGLSFPFQRYYANPNQLKQAEAVVVVSTQLGRVLLFLFLLLLLLLLRWVLNYPYRKEIGI